MRNLAAITLAVLFSNSALPASAMSNMNGSMAHGMGGTMAKCASSNPAVIVNTTKMTYMMDTNANRVAMKGMMDHDKFVCRSTAAHMGAKLKSGSMSTKGMTGKM